MLVPSPIGVLLVDDQPRNLIALEAALASADYSLSMARSGADALERVLEQDFAVIVLDVHMPEMDGFETASLIRARERSQSTPIIFLTADDRVGARVLEGYRLGAVDYLYKPFDPVVLRSKVAVFVELARKTAALEQRTAELISTALQLDLAHAAADLRHQALHDGLTGLPNRVLLYERLESVIIGSGAREGRCALLLLDLDRFKDVNDTLGHQVGDSLLRQLGQRLRDAVLVTDLVARLGGDEFAVVLPDSGGARAAQVAEELGQALHAPFILEGQSITMEASIGIAIAPEHAQDADALLRRADVAMYQAKRRGVGVVSYTHDEDDHGPDRLALLGELRHAIEHDELLLHFQPMLDLRDGTVVGVEALVRWQHPQRGFLPPGEFIPLAELSGLIHPLSRWVLEAAVRQQRAWRDLGMDFRVAVNVSRRMLHDPHLPETIAHLLARSEVPPSSLVLEITESSLMADPLRANQNLEQLRELGVCVSIDDFGTGYSSLASLKNLVVDELKIDRSFVRAMATDASARAIVRAIVDLADALKLRVVAEGVEDRATWDVLVGLGCDVAQGYLPSPPLAAAELQEWILTEAPRWLEVAAVPKAHDPLQERIRGRGARLTAEEEFVARKHAERALLASEERNRLALLAAGMGTWEKDVVRDVLTWSTETERLHGLPQGMVEGTTAAMQRTIVGEDWSAFEAEIVAAGAEQRETAATFRTVWPDGSVHWIEATGRGQYAVDGTLQRINGTSVDITERKLAEEALRSSEERFRLQYKGAPLPSYTWLQVDDDFVMQDYNDAAEALLEADVHQWIGARASERYVDQTEIVAGLNACLVQRRTIQRQLHFRYPGSGRERELALTFVFIPPQTVVVHSDDITERKQAEQQREAMARSEKLRALGQMASGIAHDLNQSLMLVSSYSDLARQALTEAAPNLDEIQDLLTTATQAALDGGETVKRLLLFTRAVPEKDTQAVDLAKVVREAAQLTAPRWRDAAQAEGHPISLHVEAEGHPTIQGSPAQLRELMTNLIFNAVDALPLGGTIRLRVFAELGEAIVEVVDSGVGMSAEVQERVFEPFFTTKGERGSGLGLAMVFGIVEQHGGHIDVRSAVGKGTIFRITLPLVADASAGTTRSPKAAVVLEPLRLLKVLVVDDEPMMTKAVARMLKPAGHLVSVAGSGEEAIEKLAEQAFDVVVSDMGMGAGMNGWELADVVRRRWPDVRFLLATGWGAAIDSTEARAKGVEAVLAKPYHPEDLLQALAG